MDGMNLSLARMDDDDGWLGGLLNYIYFKTMVLFFFISERRRKGECECGFFFFLNPPSPAPFTK